jgi:transposase
VPYNVFHHHSGHPTKTGHFSPILLKYPQITMAPPPPPKILSKEARLLLAEQAFKLGQFKSVRKAAKKYGVGRTTLQERLNGVPPRKGRRAPNNRLQLAEEQALVNWILEMERRGFPAYIIDVKRMAEQLIFHRGSLTSPPELGKHWVYRFLSRHPALKACLTRKRDLQRVRQEDPRVIQPWFNLIQRTIERYGIIPADTYNFDETGFAQGLIYGSDARKAVRSSDYVGRIVVTPPGDREWATSIECANALGWMIPSFLIFAGKVHLKDWYRQPLPKDLKTALSDNG